MDRGVMKTKAKGIILIGLGPGNPDLLTREAWSLLNTISEIHLLTAHHSPVQGFPKGLQVHSFDNILDGEEDYQKVLDQIVRTVIELGCRPEGVVYGVPGHPFIGEATSQEIYQRAKAEDLPVELIEGISLIGPTLAAIGLKESSHISVAPVLELVNNYYPLSPPNFPAIITQIHSKKSISKVKATLLALYPSNHPVQLVHAAGTPNLVVENLPLDQIDQSESDHFSILSSLYVPPLGLHTSFEEFQELIAHLRSPEGCPWDREQSHQTLRRNLMEETFEALEAIDRADPELMKEEFGDLLLQITLHAQIASENGDFTMSDVIKGIYSKLVHRHPHVFGDMDLKDSQVVIRNWERLKALERGENEQKEKGLLVGIPTSMPALAVAEAYQRRAARVGFDWPKIEGVIDKIKEEIDEFMNSDGKEAQVEEIGDILFAVANVARWVDIDPEEALRSANQQFRRRFAVIESEARRSGKQLSDMTLEEMDKIWDQAKKDQ
jgi:tetrapyrrole methylase family protein/MazG family protein